MRTLEQAQEEAMPTPQEPPDALSDGCDYMIPANPNFRQPRRCADPVVQVSEVWDTGFGKPGIYCRCIKHSAKVASPMSSERALNREAP